MKFLKKVLVNEAKQVIDWIHQDREVRWEKRYTERLIKLSNKRVWPWSKKIDHPTMEEYKKHFYRYEDSFVWHPEEFHADYEGRLTQFISHCASDLDPEFVYLNSVDIKNYGLNQILMELKCASEQK